jgi:esterase/lipase superfamily enzyme
MNREHHRWYSPSLIRDMELLVFGHGGARMLVFPTSNGKFYEWEDRGMIGLLGESIDKGRLHHVQYDNYLYHEVLPLTEQKNGNPFLITAGASFGGYHAMNFGLKHPDKVRRIVALSGLYDIRRFTGGYSDDNVYFNNPMQYIPNEHEAHRLDLLRTLDIVMATGREDNLMQSARDLSGALWGKGIGNALREWDGWAHDWLYWQKMIQLYVNGHD